MQHTAVALANQDKAKPRADDGIRLDGQSFALPADDRKGQGVDRHDALAMFRFDLDGVVPLAYRPRFEVLAPALPGKSA